MKPMMLIDFAFSQKSARKEKETRTILSFKTTPNNNKKTVQGN